MIVEEFMTPAPHTIGYEQSLTAASHMMTELGVHHLPVLDGGQVVGVVSDRDIAWVEALQNFDPDRMPVDEAISREPYVVGPEEPLLDVVLTMQEKKIGSALVIDNGHVLGVFTTTDALRVLGEILRDGKVSRTAGAAKS